LAAAAALSGPSSSQISAYIHTYFLLSLGLFGAISPIDLAKIGEFLDCTSPTEISGPRSLCLLSIGDWSLFEDICGF